MTATHSIAIDLGASSGRAMLGSLDHGRLVLRELHRFPNNPRELPTGLHWDIEYLFGQVLQSLMLARETGLELSGIGIDTWGVDYGLLSPERTLLADPHHYRDPRTHGLIDAAARRMPLDQIYSITGVQFMPLNTLYQLLADQQDPRHLLTGAASLLFMPDLLNFRLSGIRQSEHTIASTSQLFDTGLLEWSDAIIEAMRLPRSLFPSTVPPGTVVGTLLPEIQKLTGLGAVPVIAPASHDTGSAVAAVPAVGDTRDWAYISSGTWSLVGRELASPLRTAAARAANFTNECGVAGTIRFHKNIAGLWLLQECLRAWSRDDVKHSFEQLIELAAAAPAFTCSIDPDDPSFSGFGDMPAKIGEYCRRTSQPAPADHGQYVRTVLESVALKSRIVLDSLEELTGPVKLVHLVGGGSLNPLLCQFTANAAGRPVLAGPVEATAAGNVLAQAMARGELSSLADIRRVVARSFNLVRYEPADAPTWARAADALRALIARA
ncbi:MAG: rhamnulokinase [Phycisphaerales bacterium]|nr:rhamnulokinase [Phycisphaerales bacterium]